MKENMVVDMVRVFGIVNVSWPPEWHSTAGDSKFTLKNLIFMLRENELEKQAWKMKWEEKVNTR